MARKVLSWLGPASNVTAKVYWEGLLGMIIWSPDLQLWASLVQISFLLQFCFPFLWYLPAVIWICLILWSVYFIYFLSCTLSSSYPFHIFSPLSLGVVSFFFPTEEFYLIPISLFSTLDLIYCSDRLHSFLKNWSTFWFPTLYIWKMSMSSFFLLSSLFFFLFFF